MKHHTPHWLSLLIVLIALLAACQGESPAPEEAAESEPAPAETAMPDLSLSTFTGTDDAFLE